MNPLPQRCVRFVQTVVAAGCALAAGVSHAEQPPPAVAVIQRQVLTALAREAKATGFAERRQAVEDLADLHGRLEADPRFPVSPVLQSLRRRVSGRLVRVGRALAVEVVEHDSTAGDGRGAGGRQAEAQELIDLIQATVRPETWEANGGQGRIVYFANGHGLVVLAPEDVHDDLGGLLRQLR